MFEQLYKFFEGTKMYVDLFTTLAPLATLLVGFGVGRFQRDKNKKRLKKILGFRKNVDCDVVMATWEGNLEYTDDDKAQYRNLKGIDVNSYQYILFNESQALLDAETVCESAGLNSRVILKSPDKMVTSKNNVFICGGPLGNEYLRNIFTKEAVSPFQFEREFRFGTSGTWYNRHKNPESRPLQIVIEENKWKEVYVKNKSYAQCGGKTDENPDPNDYTAYSVPSGYVVYIKKRLDDHSYFACFGSSADHGCVGVRALNENTDTIYNLTKRYNDHFFLLVKSSANHQLCFDKDNVIDLTEEMFGCSEKNTKPILSKIKSLFKLR